MLSSLPTITPRLSHDLYLPTLASSYHDPPTQAPSQPIDPFHPPSLTQHQHQQSLHHISHPSPLAFLNSQEMALVQRRRQISRFGATYLRPIGVPKTLQSSLDEAAEREEAERQAERERLYEETVAREAMEGVEVEEGEGPEWEDEEDGNDVEDEDADIERRFGHDGAVGAGDDGLVRNVETADEYQGHVMEDDEGEDLDADIPDMDVAGEYGDSESSEEDDDDSGEARSSSTTEAQDDDDDDDEEEEEEEDVTEEERTVRRGLRLLEELGARRARNAIVVNARQTTSTTTQPETPSELPGRRLGGPVGGNARMTPTTRTTTDPRGSPQPTGAPRPLREDRTSHAGNSSRVGSSPLNGLGNGSGYGTGTGNRGG